MQQLQDMITTLNEELEASKEKLSKMEEEMNEDDYNTKKNMDELWDKIQVERCVNEMVGWVSEQQMTNDNVKMYNTFRKEAMAAGPPAGEAAGGAPGEEGA